MILSDIARWLTKLERSSIMFLEHVETVADLLPGCDATQQATLLRKLKESAATFHSVLETR